MKSYDVLIIGGGLIGLSCARHLVDSQLTVGVVLGTQRGAASGAAAGMLTPTCEWGAATTPAFLNLMRAGLAYYPEFLARFFPAMDEHRDFGFYRKQFLLLDLVENQHPLTERFQALVELGAPVTWLAQREVWHLEPHINPDAIRGAVLVDNEGIVNPRALHEVLRLSLVEATVDVFPANVLVSEEHGKQFVVTLDDGQQIQAAQVLIAAGVWSTEIAAQFHITLPVTVAKGQMIQFSGRTGLLQRVLYMPTGACGSLLERSPGVYIAGTSEEFVAADCTNTSRVIATILGRVNEVFLPAGDFEISDLWSGFRPFTPDELPMIGQTADPRIYVATGHFRNGVLLAPLTGKIIASLLTGAENASPVPLPSFAAERAFLPFYRFGSSY